MDIPGIKFRILKHLPAYLLRHGSVDLTGLGRFYLSSHSASIDYSKSVVFPPYYDVLFEAGSYSRAQNYINFLSSRLGLEEAMIGETMQAFTLDIQQQLARHDRVILDGMGHLELDDLQQIVFDSDNQYWGLTAVSDLAVAFVPVPRMKESVEQQPVTPLAEQQVIRIPSGDEDKEELFDELNEEVWDAEMDSIESQSEVVEVEDNTPPVMLPLEEEEQEQNNTPPVVEPELPPAAEQIDVGPVEAEIEDQKRKHRYVLPLMLLLFLLAIPLFYYLLQRDQGQNSTTTNLSKEIPQDRLNQPPVEDDVYAEEPTDSEETGEADGAYSTNPTEETTTTAQSGEVEANDASDQNEIEESETPIVEEENSGVEETSPEVEENEYNNQSINELSEYDLSIDLGECVIVVGAFGQGSNMRNMMKELESRGFKVYVDSTRELSRVGVYSTCEQSELNQNLALIRSEIEAQSWVLNK